MIVSTQQPDFSKSYFQEQKGENLNTGSCYNIMEVTSVMKVGCWFCFLLKLLSRLEDKEELEEFKSAEKYGSSCNTQSLKLGAEEITLPDVIGMFVILVTKISRGKLESEATS